MGENLNRLIDMGFSHEQAQNALRMANNDAEKAIGYLLNDLVEISNREEVPDLNALRQPSTNMSDYDAPPYEPPRHQSPFNDEAHYEDRMHIEVLSDDGDMDQDVSDVGSELELPLPEVSVRDPDQPLVILNKRFNKYENWFPPLVQTLCQIDEFKYKLQTVSESSPLAGLKGLIQELHSSKNNYIVNLLNLPPERVPLVEELIPKIYQFIGSAYKQEHEDDFIHNLVASNVQSVQDESSQDLTIIEVDVDYRFSSIYDTLNELFWGKSLENLNNIIFNSVGPILTLHYIGDQDEYYQQPLHLEEVIYPDIYSKKMISTLLKKTEQFNSLNQEKVRLSNQIMHLLIFQGKKINTILNQTKEFIKDEGVTGKLENLTTQLADERVKLNEEISNTIKEIDQNNIKNPQNLMDESMTPYRLLAVIIDEFNYFYYWKQALKWVHVVINSELEFRQQLYTFPEVKDLVSQISGSTLIPATLIYCDEHKLEEKLNPDQFEIVPLPQKPPAEGSEDNVSTNTKTANDKSDPSADDLIDL